MSAVKILVVEDERLFKRIINAAFKKQIEENQYKFDFAYNGREALEKIKVSRPDLMITDIKMPQIDGLELLARLNNQNIFIPTIIITAYANITNIREAMHQRAFDFLTKPFDIPSLQKSIEKVLDLSKKEANLSPVIISEDIVKQKKVRSTTILRLAKELPPLQKYKVVSKLIETFSLEQIEDLQFDLPSLATLAIEEEEEKERLEWEDREREEQGKVPLRLLQEGYFEERPTRKKLISGEVKEYGPYIYLRWKNPGDSKLHSWFLGKYEDITDPEVLKAVDEKLPRG